MNQELELHADIIDLLISWGNSFKTETTPEIFALRQYDIEKIINAMSVILAFGDAKVRFHAVDAIPYLVPNDVVINLLLPYLNDPIPELRWTLCELFHSYRDSRVVLPLAELLQNDIDPDVRVVAAEALFAVGDERAIPALTYATEHDTGKDYEDRTVADAARNAIVAIENRIKSK